MKKIYSILMIAATLTIMWGCSKSDDDDNNNGGTSNSGDIHGVKVDGAPHWTFNPGIPEGDIKGKPDWNEMNFYDYDNNMTAIVFISEVFGEKVTEDDRMAAIVDGEVRDVCAPVHYRTSDGEASLLCFMLYIPFDSDEDGVELQYYSAKLDQTYIQREAFSVEDDTVGDDEMFFFFLRPMMARYVVLPPDLPFTPTENDEMAVFMGDEICGKGEYFANPNPDKLWLVTAFDMNRKGEKVYARYYSAETNTVYETEPLVDIAKSLDAKEMPDTLRFK